MATENVTAIRPDAAPPRDPPAKPRRPRRSPPGGVHLLESDEHDGFKTIDVLNGLHGVCLALDVSIDSNDLNQGELATAARVLSAILQQRVDFTEPCTLSPL